MVGLMARKVTGKKFSGKFSDGQGDLMAANDSEDQCGVAGVRYDQ